MARYGPWAAARYAWGWFGSPARRRGLPALPTLLNLPVTDNCNSRCVMCNVWKARSEGEMSASDLGRVLSDPLFGDLRHVGISGGEPTLRKDLVGIVDAIVSTAPRLESLSITTHGFMPRIWEAILPEIVRRCERRGVSFTLNLSLDGVGEVHDRVRRIPRGFERLLETWEVARGASADVQLQATVSSANVYDTGRLLRFARAGGQPIVFRLATVIERLSNRESMADVALDASGRSFFADFLDSEDLARATSNPARRLFYRDLVRRLTRGGSRRAPCYFQSEGVLLDPHGMLYHCSISTEPLGNALEHSAMELYDSPQARAARERLLTRVCPGCTHDQSGAWSPGELAWEVWRRSRPGRAAARAAEIAAMAARAAVVEIRRAGSRYVLRRRAPAPRGGRTALLIGAYGGEHVGDAAILGGVVQRLVERHGLVRARVASTRPDRTRRWVECLTLPVPLDVVDAASPGLAEDLGPSDLLVHAGGPLMDLPRLLLRHLELAVAARRRGASVVLEGVGIGPFRRRASRALARRLCRTADLIRVRTPSALGDPVLPRSGVEVDRDPAFDYLERRGRGPALDRLPDGEREAIERALGERPGLRVGVNLRPLWSRYASDPAIDLEKVGARLLDELADGMERFEATAGPTRWIYFAMNADRYGFSDLDIGWELAERAGGQLEVTVLEHELGVDGILHLFDGLDVAVAMRFHANVFAFARGLPVLGIDYSVGGRGKVGELYRDRGLEDRVERVDRFTAEWLVPRLAALATAAGGRGAAGHGTSSR